MKKPSLVILALLALQVSCSKSNSGSGTPTPSISATVDGVAMTFNNNINVVKTSVGGLNQLTITGDKDAAGASHVIILVNSPNPISAKEYRDYKDLLLPDGAGLEYKSSGTFNTTTDIPDTCNIAISAISGASVSGTFRGSVLLNAGAIRHAITNGKFDVRF